MAASPFAFYRGAAAIMAADLATQPRVGLETQLCGDAHLANFGAFSSAERSLVFDLNDFDETLPGPFDWDVKRFAASLEIAGRHRGFDDAMRSGLVVGAVRSYREAMRSFAPMRYLELWYEHLDTVAMDALFAQGATSSERKQFAKSAAKAESKDQLKALAKLTEERDGELWFRSDPPLLVPVEELFDDELRKPFEASMTGILWDYRHTLHSDRRRLLDRYRYVRLARKVVGVGSVGTRAWVALFVGKDNADPLFLQVKEAQTSVLEPYLGTSAYDNHGSRVVHGQRLMQASSDIFLGWHHVTGIDGVERDFYMRQLWDWKFSADLDRMRPETFPAYAKMCAWTLARAHARTGDPVALASYLGTSDVFDRALGEFAIRYADQNDRDHAALIDAIKDGRLTAEAGI
jgi:uncharacterized protein (DUF2252 family)